MTDTATAEQVASFLRRHPDFLEARPELAQLLRVPAAATGNSNTASLASYQLDILREKNRDLGRRLKELMDTAQNNELLLHRVHLLSLRLLRAATLEKGVQQIAASLHEDFRPAGQGGTELSTSPIRLVLVDMPILDIRADWLKETTEADPGLVAFAEFLRDGHPVCGRLKPEKLQFLFGEHAAQIASAVLLPLKPCGLLAVGSTDPNRFHPGMGTLFLGLMAELMATALAVLAERTLAPGGSERAR